MLRNCRETGPIGTSGALSYASPPQFAARSHALAAAITTAQPVATASVFS